MKTESALYECTVMHHRLRPKVHRLNYRVFYLWADVDELPGLNLRWLKHNRAGLFSFRESDHLTRPGESLKENLLRFLREGGVATDRVSSIRLLTFPRVLGYIFNPVSFYYAYSVEGEILATVAEVTNTFHEKKRYLIPDADERGRFRLRVAKHFYVSPFVGLEEEFDFKLGAPGPRLEIHIDDHDATGPLLLTALTGKRRELTDGALLSCFFRYPLVTLRVMFLIHWNALLLCLKRIPWHRKADHPELQLNVHPPTPKP